MTTNHEVLALPGANLDVSRMPGHWLLARMGKRVLRPGGLEVTRKMLDGVAITKHDRVVEFAPGLGTTARLVLASKPETYTAIERDAAAKRLVEQVLRPQDQCRQGSASETGLDADSATVVLGEAMLTMHTEAQKTAIVKEAFRILRPGGRYGIHELSLSPDDLSAERKAEIQKALSDSIHVGARPLTSSEWRAVLEREGFVVEYEATAPMALLEPGRVLSDEGLRGVVRILFNILTTPGALKRVRSMRATFRRFATQMRGITLVARKPM